MEEEVDLLNENVKALNERGQAIEGMEKKAMNLQEASQKYLENARALKKQQ